MNFFAASICAMISPYVSKTGERISGMVPVRILVSSSMRSESHLEYTAVLIFWMIVHLTRLQRLNWPTFSLCRCTASAIWNCVALGTCTCGPG